MEGVDMKLRETVSLHNVVDAGDGVEVVVWVEGTGEVSLLAAVLTPTHVLAAHLQPHPLAPAPPRPGAGPAHHLHSQGVGVGVEKPGGVRPLLIADLQSLPLLSVLLNLEVAGVAVQVQGGDLRSSNDIIISKISVRILLVSKISSVEISSGSKISHDIHDILISPPA